ncbi:MAG: ATPase, partial [Candidatus Lokiarchaeota archaeon]|nr:ATPase [Candidatus Lokiarchaeota archaeon]
ILFIGTVMMIGTLFMFLYGLNTYTLRIKAQTLAFTTMAMFQVFNSLNCRSRTKSVFELGIFTNKYLIGAIIISVTLQICAIYLLFFNIILGTTPISLLDWLLIILISSSVFLGDELRKVIRKKLVHPSK